MLVTGVLSKDFVTTKVHECVLLVAVVRVCCALVPLGITTLVFTPDHLTTFGSFTITPGANVIFRVII